MHLQGKTALVTGSSRGIGRAIALELARHGAAVGINYRTHAEAAASVESQIRASGGRALSVQADISERPQAEAMVERVAQDLGPIDILVNNAGVLVKGDLDDFDFSQMDAMRRTNVDGLVHVTRAVVAGMRQRGFGRIVNLTSIAAIGTAFAGTTFYAATKSAVTLLTRRFAMDLGPYGITVNAIAPGYILTDMVTAGKTEAEIRGITEGVAAKAMMRRTGRPEDIANAVSFLVSPASSFITAQLLTVDGGRMDYIAHP